MMAFISQISFFLFIFLSAATFHLSMSSNHKVVGCNEKDRRTLLIFKQGIIDPFNLLSSWSNVEDCCAWEGVECHNTTGRVIELDLSYLSEVPHKTLKGEINLSLLELEFLNYLDLSINEFDVISIPPIHHNITIVSKLYYLNLAWNNLRMDNLQWLSRLSFMKYLDLSGSDLQRVSNWLQLVAMLPSLLELRLTGCNLNNISPSLMYVNFTSLVTLDLSYSYFNSMLPYWLFNLSSDISYINLGGNNFYGEIPSSSLSLRKLRYLDLSYNQLNGIIPDWIGHQEHLQHLDLSHNSFSGSIPSFLGNFTSLIFLSIGSTSLSGAISEIHFSKLKHLEELDLSNSTFSFHFNPEWIPPFQLSGLSLENTNQGPSFPSWIYSQKSLQTLDISSSGISFIDEDKFGHLVAGIELLYLFNNSINGDISNIVLNSTVLWLNQNNFTGGIPHISPKAFYIDLSHNSFSGPIPHGWENFKYLIYLNLWSNRLSGELPRDLSNMTQLNFLNLGNNEFSGTLPIVMPSYLEVMILRSNQFEGNIPPHIFNLSSLFHLDLAYNKLSGSMPHSAYNITQMITNNIHSWFVFNIDLFTKAQYYEPQMDPGRRTIDVSVNNLSGEIPLQLFGLIQVQTLNLSHNHFNGRIHETIGNMKNLESLDFSNNNLSGEIPRSMAGLSFLGYLNLSCNNFIGQIPTGTQLQGFGASSYIGNAKLCGAPLTKCITNEENPEKEKQHAENGDDPLRNSLYLGMGVGFAMGFWGICGSLIFIRKWRHLYYKFLDQMADQLYVTFTVKINNLHKS